MKKDSWTSQFRKKKFHENHNLKKEDCYFEELSDPFKRTKTIAVMLDLDGTCDNLDDNKADIFISQLELLRRKFKADIATISISTHYIDAQKIEPVLEILSKKMTKKFEIGTCFFYGGTYNYQTKEEKELDRHFNSNKVKTFDEYYISNPFVENIWSAFFDDNIYEETYKKYQNKKPVLIGRPSKSTNDTAKNNFMSIATTTKGFDGVIEILDTYISSIQNLNTNDILNCQRNMMTHLSSFELTDKIRNRNYQFLEQYFQDGYADENDYNDTITWLTLTTIRDIPNDDELEHLNNIFNIICEKFQNDEANDNVKKIKILKSTYLNK